MSTTATTSTASTTSVASVASWDDLVAAALLGTERRTPPVAPRPGQDAPSALLAARWAAEYATGTAGRLRGRRRGRIARTAV
ncbi:hypothetical protein ABZ390_46605, partial [Streptomyces solisilvae]